MKNRGRSTELPDVIVQRIHSYLENKEAAQTILVSKSWLRAWSTRPFLDFNSSINVTIPSVVIDRTLKSYVEQRTPIVRFCAAVYTIQERWLKMARRSNVIELRLAACRHWTTSLFQEIFITKSLQVLSVATRDRTQNFIVLSHSDIRCVNLRKFDFFKLTIDAVTFQYIMSSCPLIDELQLKDCDLIHVPSSNLEKVQSFMFAGECARLKRLSLLDTKIDDDVLHTIISKSPHLEDLNLLCCVELVKPINLSSVSLKRVNIIGTKVQIALIDTPNLHNLKYTSLESIPFPVTITSPITKGVVKVTIVYQDALIDESWFLGLRDFLAKFEKSNVKFTAYYYEPVRSSFKLLRATLPPPWYQVETLRFKGSKDLPLLHAFFGICHPKIVLLDPMSIVYKPYLLLNLLEGLSYDKENLECCSSSQNKCWQHYLKDAKLYYLAGNGKRPLDMNSVKDGWSCEFAISLDLEWESSY